MSGYVRPDLDNTPPHSLLRVNVYEGHDNLVYEGAETESELRCQTLHRGGEFAAQVG